MHYSFPILFKRQVISHSYNVVGLEYANILSIQSPANIPQALIVFYGLDGSVSIYETANWETHIFCIFYVLSDINRAFLSDV